jgi:hypothetical protein
VIRAGRLLLAVALAGSLLVACGSSDDESAASAPTSASPTPTPTPSAVIWAGEVCGARDDLNAAVSSLGRNLSYDVSSDRSALDQIDRQLRLQVLAVGDALNGLGTALAGVPADLKEANDFVVNTTKAKQDADEAIAEAQSNLNEMVNSGSILDGVAAAGKAIIAAKAAYEAGQALVGEVSDLVSAKGGELSDAFAEAPECQS